MAGTSPKVMALALMIEGKVISYALRRGQEHRNAADDAQRDVIDLIAAICAWSGVIVSPQEIHRGSGRPPRKGYDCALRADCSINGCDRRPTSSRAGKAPIDPMPWNLFSRGGTALSQVVGKVQGCGSPATVIAQRRHEKGVGVTRGTGLEVGGTAESPRGERILNRRILGL